MLACNDSRQADVATPKLTLLRLVPHSTFCILPPREGCAQCSCPTLSGDCLDVQYYIRRRVRMQYVCGVTECISAGN